MQIAYRATLALNKQHSLGSILGAIPPLLQVIAANLSPEIGRQLTSLQMFAQQGRKQAIRRVGSLRTKSGPSNFFYSYGDFKTCVS